MKRVEIAIVTFGSVRVSPVDFHTVDGWQPPHLTASVKRRWAAIVKGLEDAPPGKDQYRANAIEVFRPWVFLITDGGPTDQCSRQRRW